MKLRITIIVFIFAAAATGAFAVEKSKGLPRVVVPPIPLKFLGGGLVQIGTDVHILSLGASVWGKGAVAGGGMTFMGRRMVDEGDGGYHLNIHDIEPRPGMPVVVTFKGPGAGAPLYTGTVPVPPLIVFENPVNDARIDVSGTGALVFRWSGGNPPYRLWIYRIGSAVNVVDMTGIAATRVSIPFSKFISGNRYRVHVRDAKRKFSFDRPVDPDTTLSFDQLTEILFHTL